MIKIRTQITTNVILDDILTNEIQKSLIWNNKTNKKSVKNSSNDVNSSN